MAKKKLSKSQFIEEAIKLFEEYQDTTGAILEDYLADDEMITELGAADANFIEAIEKLEVSDFDSLLEGLKEIDLNRKKTTEILNVLDENWIRDHVNGEGDFILIKVEDINKRALIEDFIKEKIYPSYNEQQANLFL